MYDQHDRSQRSQPSGGGSVRKFTKSEIHYFEEASASAYEAYHNLRAQSAALEASIVTAELKMISTENMLTTIEKEAKA